jgi:hypothetical protein
MLCENPKTNVAAINSRKSRGSFKNLFLVRVIIGLTFILSLVTMRLFRN